MIAFLRRCYANIKLRYHERGLLRTLGKVADYPVRDIEGRMAKQVNTCLASPRVRAWVLDAAHKLRVGEPVNDDELVAAWQEWRARTK
jgi:hypothetical protein